MVVCAALLFVFPQPATYLPNRLMLKGRGAVRLDAAHPVTAKGAVDNFFIGRL